MLVSDSGFINKRKLMFKSIEMQKTFNLQSLEANQVLQLGTEGC